MPLTEPSAAGGGGGFSIAGGTVLLQAAMRNSGTDTGVNFQRMIWNDVLSEIFVSGNNGYTGTKTLVTDKLVQTTAVSVQDCLALAINNLDGGIIRHNDIGNIHLSDAGITAWTAITPAGVTPRGCFSILGDDNIYVPFDELAAPQRNIAISTDQGATWDTSPGLFAPLSGAIQSVISSRDRTRIALTPTVGTNLVVCTADPNGAWFTHSVPSSRPIHHGAWSDDLSIFVCSNNVGQLFVIENPISNNDAAVQIAIANNPFAQTATNGLFIDFINFVPELGFVMGDISSNIVARIAVADLTLAEQGVYLGDSITFGFTTNVGSSMPGVVDALGNFQAGGSSNQSVMFYDPDA